MWQRLVIEGNAVYEIDDQCAAAGLTRQDEKKEPEKGPKKGSPGTESRSL